jgi:hypothetical protein
VSVPLYLKVKVGPVYATGGTALNFKVAENTKFATLLPMILFFVLGFFISYIVKYKNEIN